MWRFLNESNRLLVRVIESKYGKKTFLCSGVGVWGEGGIIERVGGWRRCRISGKMLVIFIGDLEGWMLRDELERVVGRGDRTKFWKDKWVSWGEGARWSAEIKMF